MATAHRRTKFIPTSKSWQPSGAIIAGAAIVGTALIGTLAAFVIGAFRRTHPHSGAFAHGETDPHNLDQTRSAGPGSMRDGSAHDWDKIDQALDESFPASDPIGVSHID